MQILIYTILSGIFSGLSLLITSSVLAFWTLKIGVPKESLGLIGLVALPYGLNFLWSPLIDGLVYKIKPQMAHKYFSAQMIILAVLNLGLTTCIALTGKYGNSLSLILLFSGITSIFGASKDALLGGIKSQIVDKQTVYKYSGIYVASYRIGMLISGSGAVLLSDYYSWPTIYYCLSGICFLLGFLICINMLFLVLDNTSNIEQNYIYKARDVHNALGFTQNLKNAFREIRDTQSLYPLLAFLMLYRLPDNLVATLINAFLLEQTYTATEIAAYSKSLGLAGSILGGILATRLMQNNHESQNHIRYFGLWHGLSYLFLSFQAIAGKNILLLCIGVIFTSVTGGMTMAAYMSIIVVKSAGQYSVAKYSCFTSIMGLSRTILPVISGVLIMYTTWWQYFTICALLMLPGIFISKLLEGQK